MNNLRGPRLSETSIEALGRTIRLGSSNLFMKSLMAVQFTFSVFLIIGTLVILRQLDYVRRANLGIDTEHVIVIPTSSIEGNLTADRYRRRVSEQAGVVGVASTSSPVLASPAAYIASSRWLGNFAYRIDLTVAPLAIGGALALVIALLTVSVKTLKAARSNPIDSLQYE